MASEEYLAARKIREDEWKNHVSSYKEIEELFDMEWSKIQQGHKELKEKKDGLMKENGGSDVSDSDILHINAGGEIIHASRGTLTQIKGSVLEGIFSGRWEKQLQRDNARNIFLDVNPDSFRSIVDYLNECKIAPPENPPFLPKPDDEHREMLNSLCKAFGLTSDVAFPDSNILVDEAHVQALMDFLDEDGVRGEMSLLFRGTRDGMNANAFLQKCNGKKCTVTVVKTTDGYIFGGYSDTVWRVSGEYSYSKEAFLFSLQCHASTSPQKFKLNPDDERYATYVSGCDGLSFGGGHDLQIFPSAYSDLGNSYMIPAGWDSESLAGTSRFSLVEVEVYCIDTTIKPTMSAGRRHHPEKNQSPVHKVKCCTFPKNLQVVLEKEKEALANAAMDLAALKENFDREECAVTVFCKRDDDQIVRLNVSGRIMAVKTLSTFPDSVLYKHFVDTKWNPSTKRKMHPTRDWTSQEVCQWVRSLKASSDVSHHFADVTGAELLSMDSSHIKDLGITRHGTVALLEKAINKLRDEEEENSAHFVEHSSWYCIGKILDHMRLMSWVTLGLPEPKPPTIRDSDKNRFQRIVEYFFPTPEMSSNFFG